MYRQRLQRSIVLSGSLDEVFAFFADAANLERLTPPWLRFSLRTEPPITMAAGTRIDYRLRIRGIPVTWTSLISAWEPPLRFVDEQVRGPYRLWVHEHRFTPVDETHTRVEDDVTYAVLGGRIVDRLLVAPDLRRIFDYRTERLEDVFGSSSSGRNAGETVTSPRIPSTEKR